MLGTWLVLAYENLSLAFIPKFMFYKVTLKLAVAQYLHHGNWEMTQIRASLHPPPEPLVKHSCIFVNTIDELKITQNVYVLNNIAIKMIL